MKDNPIQALVNSYVSENLFMNTEMKFTHIWTFFTNQAEKRVENLERQMAEKLEKQSKIAEGLIKVKPKTR